MCLEDGTCPAVQYCVTSSGLRRAGVPLLSASHTVYLIARRGDNRSANLCLLSNESIVQAILLQLAFHGTLHAGNRFESSCAAGTLRAAEVALSDAKMLSC